MPVDLEYATNLDARAQVYADDALISKADIMVAKFIADGIDPAVIDTPESRAQGRAQVRKALDEVRKEKQINV
jgi:hypothetical protein